jgi:hypothetical protein
LAVSGETEFLVFVSEEEGPGRRFRDIAVSDETEFHVKPIFARDRISRTKPNFTAVSPVLKGGRFITGGFAFGGFAPDRSRHSPA